jgi:MerR HTH family regulatory protein
MAIYGAHPISDLGGSPANHPFLATSAAANLLGLTPRQLQYLAQKGVVRPSVRHAGRRGVEAIYDAGDLRALFVIARVRAICGCRIDLERLGRLLAPFVGGRGLDSGLILSDGSSAWTPAERPQPPSAVLRIDLGALEDELAARLERSGIPSAPSQGPVGRSA